MGWAYPAPALMARLSRHLFGKRVRIPSKGKDQGQPSADNAFCFVGVCLEPRSDQDVERGHHDPLKNGHTESVADEHGEGQSHGLRVRPPEKSVSSMTVG